MKKIPLSKTKIETKLAIIRESLAELEKFACMEQQEFLADKTNFAAAEHYLRRALEALFDIAFHIISRFPFSPGRRPDTLKGVAVALGKKKVIDEGFAQGALSQMAGYRNRMVHFYDEITPEELYEIITTKLGDIETFTSAIVKVVDTPEKFELSVGE
jgi:uncharacterized protein YutE (UPF0331/DUF86 family)